jgi:hypothetical protein
VSYSVRNVTSVWGVGLARASSATGEKLYGFGVVLYVLLW